MWCYRCGKWRYINIIYSHLHSPDWTCTTLDFKSAQAVGRACLRHHGARKFQMFQGLSFFERWQALFNSKFSQPWFLAWKKINIRPQFACSVLYFQTNLWYLAACVCVKVRFCFCMLPHEGVAEHVRKRRNPQRRWTVLLWDRFRGNYGESFLLKGKLRAGYTAKGAPRQAMRGCFYCRSRLRGAYAQYLSYARGYARLRKATQRYATLRVSTTISPPNKSCLRGCQSLHVWWTTVGWVHMVVEC